MSPPNLAFGSTQLGPFWFVSGYALSIDASRVLVEQTHKDGQYTTAVEATLSQGLATCAVRVVHEKLRVREYEFQIKHLCLTQTAQNVKTNRQ